MKVIFCGFLASEDLSCNQQKKMRLNSWLVFKNILLIIAPGLKRYVDLGVEDAW